MIYIFFNFKQLACKCDINSFNYLQIVHTSRQPTHIHTHTHRWYFANFSTVTTNRIPESPPEQERHERFFYVFRGPLHLDSASLGHFGCSFGWGARRARSLPNGFPASLVVVSISGRGQAVRKSEEDDIIQVHTACCFQKYFYHCETRIQW
jgi:hypothetical protein